MSPIDRPWWARRVLGGLPVPVLVGGALAVFGLSAVVVRANGERASLGAAADTTLLTIPTSGPATSGPSPTTASAPATTNAPATSEAPATSPATTAPATSAPATSAPATAAPVVEATTVAPTTAPPTAAPATTAPADGRVVEITSRVGSCSFGSNCLVAGFKLVGFRNADTFVCIFADGSRNTFRMRATEVKTACSTSRDPDSITIEVDGVRSETVTR